MLGKILVGLTIASFLPIWRAPGRTDMNYWEYVDYMRSEEYWQHHTEYEIALAHARSAWEQSGRQN